MPKHSLKEKAVPPLARSLAIALGALSASTLMACSSADGPQVVELESGDEQPNARQCETPDEGCACNSQDLVECGVVKEEVAGGTICTIGKRSCEDGVWSACRGESETTIPKADKEIQGLGTSVACPDNPCDPYCNSFTDTGTGLIAPGFDSADGTLSIEGVAGVATMPCTSLSLTPSSGTMTITNIENQPPTGLLGEYFNRFDDAASEIPSGWTPTDSRIDQSIDFAMGGGSPGVPGIGNDVFSIRWTGDLIPDVDGSYRFATYSDDGMRLWMNGTLIIDRWNYQAPTWIESGDFTLTAGTAYDIRSEFFEAYGGAHAQLYWRHPVNGWQVIPPSAYSPPGAVASGFTTSPANIDFDAELLPAGCYTGSSTPLYSLNRFDSSAIDVDGIFETFSPIAGDVNVTSYIGTFSAGATVSVTVSAHEVDRAPAGSETNHAKSSVGFDPATILYPYADTVFPLGIEPPVLQWDDGSSAADSVQISLKYPSTGTPEFHWSEIVSESSPPRFAIPEYAWKAFEQTAKGEEGLLVLERVVGGNPRDEIERPIQFADGPLRGKIYYTQYGRDGSTKAMIADPGGDITAQDAYAGGSDGCPVCHSVSANGNVFVTADNSWSTQGGFSEVRSDGFLEAGTDHPGGSPYTDYSNDWRGFAWAPLTPDGQYALTANNIYGNTWQSIIGIDDSTDTVDVPDYLISGANGTGLLAEFYSGTSLSGTRWASFTPHITYDYGSGSPGGPIGSNFSARFSGQVMPYYSEDYTFHVTTTDGVRLTVDGTVLINDTGYQGGSKTHTVSIALTGGEKTDIELEWYDTSGDAELQMDWESFSTPLMVVPVEQLFPNDGQHGVEARFYSSNNFTNLAHTEIEPNIYHNWGSGRHFSVGSNNHSTEWRGQLEAPITGNIRLCIHSDDDGRINFNGVDVVNQTGVVNRCSSDIAVVEGQLYDLFVSHREFSGGSYVRLSWESSLWSRTAVSGAYLRPPSSWTKPTEGLELTLYDGANWTSGQGDNPNDSAYTTYVDTAHHWYGGDRHNHSLITNNDNWSARYVGEITLPCDGIYEFRSNADDASALWIDQNRIQSLDSNGTSYGSSYFEAGTYDFKYQYNEYGGSAYGELEWIPRCTGASSYAQIPSTAFSPTGTGTGGFVIAGGDNGNGVGYWVWETPDSTVDPPEDVTWESDGNWGLGTTAMMVPSFAPDASALVFVDGDSSGGAGWRKGLSVFDFDQDGKLFSNRRNIVSTWPNGHVIKWPVFESDSRSVLYSASTPVDWCCKGGWTRYGHMSPTNYFETVGILYSVDADSANPQIVELEKLNEGERPEDANKAYQPTMLPISSAGYRWVVFTSTRPYGNTFNETQNDYSDPESFTPMVRDSVLQSTLWIAAIDDEVSAGTDRSHPAFLLPNQNFSESASNGVLNERGFWALDACRPVGTGAESECEVDEDCCGGTGDPQTAVCALDIPVSSPPTRHCQNRPSIAACVPRGGTCGGADCCLGDVCVNAQCTAPPPISTLVPVNFTRDFEADCPIGTTDATWRIFDWQGESPGDGYVEFYAQSADDPADFEVLPDAPNPVMSSNVVGVAIMAGATIPGWVGQNVGALLDAAGLIHRRHLRITMRFHPPTDASPSPSLTTWRMGFSCIPDE